MTNIWKPCITCSKQFYYDSRVLRCARCSREFRENNQDVKV